MIKAKIYRDVFTLLTAFIAFTLPFSIRANSFSIVVLLVFFLISGPSFNWKKLSLRDLVLPGFYFLFLLGMIYTNNIKEGLFQLEVKLGFLIFPLVFCLSATKIEIGYRFIIKAFNYAIVISAILCLLYSLILYIHTQDTQYFFREQLCLLLAFHPIYYSLFIGTSILLQTKALSQNWRKNNNALNFFYLSIILFLFFFNILLTAKMPLLALSFVLLLYFQFLIRSTAYKVLAGVFVISAVLGLIYVLPYAHEQFASILNSKLYFDYEENNANSLTLRLVKWECSLEGFKENLIGGVGTGDAQDYLQNCYKSKNFWGSVFNYNSHSEYLSIALRLGLIGLLYFVFLIGFLINCLWKEKSFFCILILFLLCCTTESMLSVQKGVIFFSFFITVFYYSLKSEN
ncbi:MAG TPA: O-antigen ligase family protein [Cytophagales bacterium]|nr:O-antigen ligase family protein [Cytophagales bacterium]